MISYIKGTVLRKSPNSLIILIQGIGYKVFTNPDTLEAFGLGDEAEVWTYKALRENSEDLYGFKNDEDINFFELLLTVSGIGPKTALNILSIASSKSLAKAIAAEDASHLIKVSGIGKKAAEKIVLELRGKVGAESVDSKELRDEEDALEALASLGYSKKTARDALQNLPKNISGTAEKVRHALKSLTS